MKSRVNSCAFFNSIQCVVGCVGQMPTHFGPDPLDSDSDDEKPNKDEYGDNFEDYGFLKRAEEYKEAGNSDFKKERYEKALKEYDNALEQLLTVAYDKSIIIGKKKWNDIIVFRSLVHLNKSTCYYKIKKWQKASEEALECLMGNVREEMMFTDPHIRAKVKQADRKNGYTNITYVEQRLPRITRAKAWFRMSQCYAQLDYLDRAKESLAKALEMCDDQQFLAEISNHSLRIDILEKQQKERQKKQFKGFWDKFQDRGGYANKNLETKAHWDKLNYADKFKFVEDIEDGNNGDPMLPLEERVHVAQKDFDGNLSDALPLKIQSALKDFKRYNNQNIDINFEAYLQSKNEREDSAIETNSTPPCLDAASSTPVFNSHSLDTPNFASRPPENIPSRPSVREEAPLKWQSEVDDPPRLSSSLESNVCSASEVWAQRGTRKVKNTNDISGEQGMERSNKMHLLHLESLDDSSDDEEGVD